MTFARVRRFLVSLLLCILWGTSSSAYAASSKAASDPLKQIVDGFFPDYLPNNPETGRPSHDSCYVVYDRTPDGQARTLIAAYTNYGEGAVRVLQAQGEQRFQMIFELKNSDYFFGGESCEFSLVDLDGDGRNEIQLAFGDNGDWYFRWDGSRLTNLGPTYGGGDGSPPDTVFRSSGPIDLDHDGVMEIAGLGSFPKFEAPTENIYRYDGQRYLLSGSLIFFYGFERATGKPTREDVGLRLSPSRAGTYVLRVVNGDRDPKTRASSAHVLVNGVEVLSPNQFSKEVEFLRVPIALGEKNEIRATVESAPGSKIYVLIEPGPDSPPQPSAANP